ncbi:MAG: topoisomerase II [SAR86 cluster bacterium]|uniref:Topoisomerase II n=1 Tax=SAR86 cluster bacterium TaxID=2030880 RepID=A0A2A4WX65_9GAMM|nr:MAG: topoisomerase II [SAR86 cluster bacterium]
MNNKLPIQRIRFRLAIPAEKYLAYYQGNAKDIAVHSEDNRNVRFPASAIRQFLTHDGIFGRFEIQFDENNKLIGVSLID